MRPVVVLEDGTRLSVEVQRKMRGTLVSCPRRVPGAPPLTEDQESEGLPEEDPRCTATGWADSYGGPGLVEAVQDMLNRYNLPGALPWSSLEWEPGPEE